MNPLRIVIVDDEKRIRSSLINVIKLHYSNAIVVAEAEDVDGAVNTIKTHNPDVVLLDIKMSDGTGFDVLKKLTPFNFKVIFITAFDKYAIEAFKFSASDYLLKPVIPHELVSALDKAKNLISTETLNAKFSALVENMSGKSKDSKKIVLNTHDCVHVVNLSDIVRCEAEGNYTNFIFKNKNKILVSGSLIEYGNILAEYNFFRSHHSHLVNLAYVDKFDKKDGGKLIMQDGSSVLVSVRKKDELLKALSNL